MKAIALLYEGFNTSDLSFFDHLQPTPEIIYASVAGSTVSGYNTIPLQSVTTGATDKDVFLVPGGTVRPVDSAQLVTSLKELATSLQEKGGPLAMIDGSSKLLAQSHLLDGRCVAAASEDVSDLQSQLPEVQWIDRNVYRSSFWIWHASGSTDSLRQTAVLISASLQGSDYWISETPFQFKSSQPAPTSGADFAIQLLPSKNETNGILDTFFFAGRLAAEGFLSAATTIVSTVFAEFPNSASELFAVGHRGGFEILWAATGTRPDIGLAVPNDTELEEWDWAPSLPTSSAGKDILLSATDCLVELGALQDPVTDLALSIAVAQDVGDNDRARGYMDVLARIVIDQDMPFQFTRLLSARCLSGFILGGVVARHTGRTVETANADADAVVSALLAWPVALKERLAQRTAHPPETLSYTEIIERLAPLKWEKHATLSFPPASADDVASAEARLGLALPNDYKEFLRTSNGLNFIPSLNIPGLRPVAELEWADAGALGLSELAVDLGKGGVGWDVLPRFGRIVMLSQEDDEEMVWLVEPAQVQAAFDAIQAATGTAPAGPANWRVVYWQHWMPQQNWYSSFRSYLESVVRRA